MRVFLVCDHDFKNFFYKPIIYAFPGCDAQPVQAAFFSTAKDLHSIGFRDFNDGFNETWKPLSIEKRNPQPFFF